MMTFGDKLIIMRAARKISQGELASKGHSGVSYKHINQCERGKRELNPDEQFRVRVALCWPEWMDIIIGTLISGGFEK